MVLRAPRHVVGSIGFPVPPDRNGRVFVASPRGPSPPDGQICVASVSPDNAPQLALARSLWFRHVGQQIDDVGGLELVFERQLPLPSGGDRSVRRTDVRRDRDR